MGGIKWSDTEDALISKLISEGYSSTEILPKLKGRTISGLKRRIFLLGVMEKPHQTKKSEKLQTGKPKGTFKRGNPHPVLPDLVYINWNYQSKSEYWSDQTVLKKKSDALKLWKQKNKKEISEKFFKKWSETEDALISKLVRQGYSSTEVLSKLNGRTLSGLRKRISVLRVVEKRHQTKKSEKLQTGKPKGTFKRGDPHPKYPELVFSNWNFRNNSEYWVTELQLKKMRENAAKRVKNLTNIEITRRQKYAQNYSKSAYEKIKKNPTLLSEKEKIIEFGQTQIKVRKLKRNIFRLIKMRYMLGEKNGLRKQSRKENKYRKNIIKKIEKGLMQKQEKGKISEPKMTPNLY